MRVRVRLRVQMPANEYKTEKEIELGIRRKQVSDKSYMHIGYVRRMV